MLSADCLCHRSQKSAQNLLSLEFTLLLAGLETSENSDIQ